MTDIAQARLLKAREIAGECRARFTESLYSPASAEIAALAALNLADWQPPEDPDERAAYLIYLANNGSLPWEARHKVGSMFPGYLAAYKAGKAAA